MTNEDSEVPVAADDAQAATGVASGGEQPDREWSESTATAPDRSDDETPSGLAGAGEQPHRERGRRKLRDGVVVSHSMDKTAVVAVVERVPHPKYNKFVLQTKRLYAHDESNDVHVGDKVRVMETRPLSKLKRWRVTEVLERAK